MNVPGPPALPPAGGPGTTRPADPRPGELPYSCNCGSREFRMWRPRGKTIARIFCAKCGTEFGIGFKC